MAFGEVSGLHGINAGRLGLDVPGQSLLRYNAVCQPFQNLPRSTIATSSVRFSSPQEVLVTDTFLTAAI